jgi:hypothetical protein
MKKLIKGMSSKILEEFVLISGPFEKLLNVMLKHSENLNVNIIIKVSKSAGFPDFFLKEYENADNYNVVYLLEYADTVIGIVDSALEAIF